MKIFLDTNIILDHLLARPPYHTAAAMIFMATEYGQIKSYVSSTAITTVYYLCAKALGDKPARHALEKLLQLFAIAPITQPILTAALACKFKDFEDAVVHEAAHDCKVKGIVTRNIKDFRYATIPIFSPEEFVNSLPLLTKKL